MSIFPAIFKIKNRELPIGKRTHIMGILNVTPDSFYDGGEYREIDNALRQAERMILEGADIIDVGGESTRPGSKGISEEEELSRVIPVIKETAKRFDTPISIDTTKSNVAYEALGEGASLINDIGGLKFDPGIADVAAEQGAGLILMHTPDRPSVMQRKTVYDSLIDDIKTSLSKSVELAQEKGVPADSIIIDPGFGFGKTTSQNLLLLRHLDEFLKLGKPILIGTSRKSFIGKVLGTDSFEGRLEGTAATLAVGIMKGASLVRVHDVLHMKRVAVMVDAVLRAG